MKDVLSQGWWVPVAAVLAVCDVLIGGWIISAEQNPGSIVGGSLFVLGGILLVVGLVQRPRNRALGTGLILFGAFWGLPLFWLVVPPVLAITVIAGLLTGAPRPAGGISPAR
jgi:hypothetical protein